MAFTGLARRGRGVAPTGLRCGVAGAVAKSTLAICTTGWAWAQQRSVRATSWWRGRRWATRDRVFCVDGLPEGVVDIVISTSQALLPVQRIHLENPHPIPTAPSASILCPLLAARPIAIAIAITIASASVSTSTQHPAPSTQHPAYRALRLRA